MAQPGQRMTLSGTFEWLGLSQSFLRLHLNDDLRWHEGSVRGLVLDVGGEPVNEVAFR